jgi:hypothetical protein
MRLIGLATPVLSELPFHRGLRELGWIEVGQVSSRRRGVAAQDGFHIGRQLIEALSREHDGPSGQSGLAPVALARKGAPGLEVKKNGEMYRQQPDGLLQGRCRNGQLDRGRFIHRGRRRPSMSHRRLSRNCRPPIVRADG